MFIFLLAGHEVRYSLSSLSLLNQYPQTVAHTLCFTLALLALYPEEQEHLYQHIKDVTSGLNGTPVGYRNFNS